jgi:hypothetical protein
MPHYWMKEENVVFIYNGISFSHKEEWNFAISDLSQVQKANFTSFLSYVEYKPNTNRAILWEIGHDNGRSQTRVGG